MPVVYREGLPSLIREQQQRAVQEWAKYRPLQRFLQDHFTTQWAKIRHCGTGYYRTYENVMRPGRYKAVQASCHQLPFCILCVRVARYRRLMTAMDQFHRCTPKGEQPRFIHIVQTAPLTDDGEGWGMTASQDLKAFGGVVWRTLVDHFGDGIGAVMSYQDFGEQGFAKRHPHMDLTLNGWRLEDSQAVKTPRIDLTGSGRRRWDESFVKHAQSVEIGARRGNLDVTGVRIGVQAYWKILQYQMRELVDLRKLDYDRDKQLVYWKSYRDGQRQKMTAGDFVCGLYEYRNRLGVWGAKPSQNLHRRYGHLSKRTINQTQRKMDGVEQKHRKNCPCIQCSDWDRVFLPEVESGMARSSQWREEGKLETREITRLQ